MRPRLRILRRIPRAMAYELGGGDAHVERDVVEHGPRSDRSDLAQVEHVERTCGRQSAVPSATMGTLAVPGHDRYAVIGVDGRAVFAVSGRILDRTIDTSTDRCSVSFEDASGISTSGLALAAVLCDLPSVFWSRPFLPADDVDALLDVIRFVFSHVYYGTDSWREWATVVEPLPENFPVDSTLEHEDLAEDYLGFVVEHAGLSDWPFFLLTEPSDANEPPADPGWNVAAPRERPPLSEIDGGRDERDEPTDARVQLHEPPPAEPASAMRAADGRLPIPYLELDHAPDLVAHLAWSVVGWQVASVTDLRRAPFDEGAIADVATVLAGFGLFCLDASCRRVEVDRSQNLMITRPALTHTTLGVDRLAFVVATMDALLGRPASATLRYLSPDAAHAYTRARKAVARVDLGSLRVDAARAPAGPYR